MKLILFSLALLMAGTCQGQIDPSLLHEGHVVWSFRICGDTLVINNRDIIPPIRYVKYGDSLVDLQLPCVLIDGFTPGRHYILYPTPDTILWTPSTGWFQDDRGEWHQVKDIERVHKNAEKIPAKKEERP